LSGKASVSGKDARPTGFLLNRNKVFDRWFGRDTQEWECKDAHARRMMLNDRSSNASQLEEIEDAKPEHSMRDNRSATGSEKVCSTHTAKQMWAKVQAVLYPVTLANGIEAVNLLLNIRPADYETSDAFLQAMKTAQICVELQGITVDPDFVVSIAINKLDSMTKYFVTLSMERIAPKDRTLAAVADHTVAWGAIFISYVKRGFALVTDGEKDPMNRKSFREVTGDDRLMVIFEKVLSAARCGGILGQVADDEIKQGLPSNIETWYTAVEV